MLNEGRVLLTEFFCRLLLYFWHFFYYYFVELLWISLYLHDIFWIILDFSELFWIIVTCNVLPSTRKKTTRRAVGWNGAAFYPLHFHSIFSLRQHSDSSCCLTGFVQSKLENFWLYYNVFLVEFQYSVKLFWHFFVPSVLMYLFTNVERNLELPKMLRHEKLNRSQVAIGQETNDRRW